MKYPVKNIVQREELEQLGTKPKFWFSDEGGVHLCKIGRANTGENWAEKAACELARLLGVPSARYELAMFYEQKAIVTPKFLRDGEQLIHGNELLANAYQLSPDGYDKEQRFKLRQYRLTMVVKLLKLLDSQGVKLPDNGAVVSDITELFMVYLLFDAWIGNQDRHDENWGVILAHNESRFSPSYDHASSLACRLTDKERLDRLATGDRGYSIEGYAAKAKTPFFNDEGKPLSTIEAFKQVTEQSGKASCAKQWLERLASITDEQVQGVFDKFPSGWISDAGVNFTVKYLAENKKRLMGLGV